jgi:hypothetical protein
VAEGHRARHRTPPRLPPLVKALAVGGVAILAPPDYSVSSSPLTEIRRQGDDHDEGRTAAEVQRRVVFAVDEDKALAELETAWADAGYHGFSADGDTWSAIRSAGDVLTSATVDELDRAIRTHRQDRQRVGRTCT